MLKHWLKRLAERFRGRQSRRLQVVRARGQTLVPRLERLEDRLAPAAAPTVTLTAPVNISSTTNDEPTLTATATDHSGTGLASVQFQYSTNGGSTWINAGAAETSGPFSYTFSTPLANGAYAFRAVATDKAGDIAYSNSGTYGSPTTLGTFYGPNGATPDGGLVEDSSGNFFGITEYGGAAGDGTVFEMASGSNALTTLASFNNTNGNSPAGTLVEDSSGNLFGDTSYGGTDGFGTVFEVASGSGAITALASFTGTNGRTPNAGLIKDRSGNLFGTTLLGGALGDGAVFKVAAGSGTITALASFNGTNGDEPNASLVEDSSGNLFGETRTGGAPGDGTVFKVAAGSGTITDLASFDGTNGEYPGGLIEDSSGNLFGEAGNGGASGDGTVFKVASGSGTITDLASFNGTNGDTPGGGLVEDSSGNLFGNTNSGGTSGDGTVFKLASGSGTITVLASLNGTNGAAPEDSLVEDSSGNLFGTTQNGGASRYGTVYEVASGSGTITALASFTGDNGANPKGSLVADGSGDLFSTTEYGGASGDGTVFEVAAGSTAVTSLASFNSTTGDDPYNGLVEDSGGNLFGTTINGGAHSAGTVFEVAAGSGVITTLASFNSTNGNLPYGGLIEDSSGNLFGTAGQGGASDDGTVFKVAAGSGAITNLASFNSTTGYIPACNLVEDSSGNLFGTTNQGGAHSDGTVFEVAAASGTITALASFNGTNGETPENGLVEDSSGNLFGTTGYGGAANDGTVFEVASGTHAITDLVSFNNTNGNYPQDVLVEDASGNLFGTAEGEGASNDGTVFEVAAGSGTITVLASFNSINGSNPSGGLVENSSGNLFGTTISGGATNNGTVFELPALPVSVTIDTPSPTIALTAPANDSFVGNNEPTLTAAAADNSGPGVANVQFQYSANGGTTWSNAGAAETSGPFSYTFTTPLADGTYAFRAVATDKAGNTAVSNSGTYAALETLGTFYGSNGGYVEDGLLRDSSGNLFGVTALYGAYGDGTVFEITAGSGTATTLASFNGSNGANPNEAAPQTDESCAR